MSLARSPSSHQPRAPRQASAPDMLRASRIGKISKPTVETSEIDVESGKIVWLEVGYCVSTGWHNPQAACPQPEVACRCARFSATLVPIRILPTFLIVADCCVLQRPASKSNWSHMPPLARAGPPLRSAAEAPRRVGLRPGFRVGRTLTPYRAAPLRLCAKT